MAGFDGVTAGKLGNTRFVEKNDRRFLAGADDSLGLENDMVSIAQWASAECRAMYVGDATASDECKNYKSRGERDEEVMVGCGGCCSDARASTFRAHHERSVK